MKELINKKLKKEKIFRVLTVVFYVLFVISFLFIPVLEPVYTFSAITGFACLCWIFAIYYFLEVKPFGRSVEALQKSGNENIADDISLNKPTLPRSKIYCGQLAMYTKKPSIILAYSDIAWVYVHKDRLYGITISKSIIVCTKGGRRYTISANSDEFQWLLENYIIKNSPCVIIGYGAEQKKRYRTLFPEVKKSYKRNKFVLGCVLAAVGAVLFTTSIVNEAIPGVVISACMMIAGMILMLIGKRR